jgi:hypothetical protein
MAKVRQRYPDLGLDIILKMGADAAFSEKNEGPVPDRTPRPRAQKERQNRLRTPLPLFSFLLLCCFSFPCVPLSFEIFHFGSELFQLVLQLFFRFGKHLLFFFLDVML